MNTMLYRMRVATYDGISSSPSGGHGEMWVPKHSTVIADFTSNLILRDYMTAGVMISESYDSLISKDFGKIKMTRALLSHKGRSLVELIGGSLLSPPLRLDALELDKLLDKYFSRRYDEALRDIEPAGDFFKMTAILESLDIEFSEDFSKPPKPL